MAASSVPHNPKRGEFVIHLGGHQRVGRLEMEQICELEVALGGASIIHMMATNRFGFEALCQCLAVSLGAVNPKINVIWVRKWVQKALYQGRPIAELTSLVQSALMRSLGHKQATETIEAARKQLQESVDPDDEDTEEDEGPGAPEDGAAEASAARLPLVPTAARRSRTA